MKYSLTIIMTTVMTLTLQAQKGLTLRQQNFPGSERMEEETIEWQQILYREVNLTAKENAALYSGADQEEELTGLFAQIFDMVMNGGIKIYKYNIDGAEKMTQRFETDAKGFLEDFHIEYTTDSLGNIQLNNSDIPYADVTMFYLKETVYYNVCNSSFRRKVLALCPVMVIEDEFSDEPVRYPLFWVRYSDIEKKLKTIYFRPDAQNVALSMTMNDFFALGRYEGKIYKVNGQQSLNDQTIARDSVKFMEEQRLTEDMKAMQRMTYNVYAKETKENFRKETVKEAKPAAAKEEEKPRAGNKRWQLALPWFHKFSKEQTDNK